MTKTWKTTLGLITLMVLSSCGPQGGWLKPAQGPTESPAFTIFRERTCDINEGVKDTQASQKINPFITQVKDFVQTYNKLYFPTLTPPEATAIGGLLHSSPTEPLIFSDKVLLAELEQIKKKWKTILGSENIRRLKKGLVKNPVILESTREFLDLSKEIHALQKKTLRWQSFQCSLGSMEEEKENDVRGLFEVESQLMSGVLISQSETNGLKGQLINMCEEFQSRQICLMEFRVHKRERKLKNFVEHYLGKMRDRLDRFYELKPRNRFECYEDNGTTIVRVPLQKDEELTKRLYGTSLVLKEYTSRKWSSKDVRVILDEPKVGEKAVKIKWTNSGLSYVNEDKPLTVFLSRYLNFTQVNVTFAHELGHIFGFPDCYVEFYDNKKKEVVYYSLDPKGKNLMCHLGAQATIPEGYLKRIKEKVCQ